ncbi:hypothetical protein ACFOPX_01455 [Helicobacter baculiformis]|uniref:Outer membrane protein n=1 Tax=Helicobacter baculiformis TaxID=427351 RepID=A0ABV7ZF78_9HELI|nr:hypothetical protein [Helicobacter baculiformis]
MRVWFYVLLMPLLSGCLNLNLKQTLPRISYYDLNTQSAPSVCANPKHLALVGVWGADLINTKDILLKRTDGQIERSVKEKFVDLPANMLKNMLVLEGMRQCVMVSMSSGNVRIGLKLNVLSLGLVEYKGVYYAQIILSVDTNAQSFMVFKSQEVALKVENKELEIPVTAIRALQHVSTQAIAQVITQLKVSL